MIRLRPYLILFLLCAMSMKVTLANVPGGGNTGPDVKLKESGNEVVLSNGIVEATIVKASATVTSLRYKDKEMTTGHIYYSMDGGQNYTGPSNCEYSVKKSPNMMDVGLRSVWKSNRVQAFDIEVHYVLFKGASGLYTYAILNHPANYPATTVGEWRMVWKLSNDLLEKIYVDDLRHWQMPSSEDYKQAEPMGIKEIVKLTTGVRAGKYDCKYDFSAEYWDLGCWGHASDKNKIGGWIVLGSHEFFNDGPTKQDLNAASGINHIHFGLDHYNASSTTVAAGQDWKKVYGPFLLYCNYNEAGGDACWKDAQAQAHTEAAAWPYAWLTGNSAYPLANQRGAVTGRFIVKDSLKPAMTGSNAWIGLAQPAPGGNWQFESMNYQFWVKTDSQGQFSIPKVRLGTYTLFAFTDGEVGEFSKANVTVNAGRPALLGDLIWNVTHKGRTIAWEIGVADRTAKEFRHGNDYFQGYLWQNFSKEFSNPLEYTVGKSDWSKDWNYAQSWYDEGGNVTPWKWRIHFNLSNIPSGTAILTLAIASAHQHAHLDMYVNDEPKSVASVTPSIQGGNALLREGIHAKYCVEYVSIPTSKLKSGENTITLVQTAIGTQSHVMYDYLSLELP